MTKVLLFHPQAWFKSGHWSYLNHTPGQSGRWKDFFYSVNAFSDNADFVVVHDDVDEKIRIQVPDGCVGFITGEEKSAKMYHQDFLNQFDFIITSRDDISHREVIRTHYFHPWQVKRTYDELKAMTHVEKAKRLSAIVSNACLLEGHKKRFSFISKLKGHYKNELDWFSKGESTFIEDKWDGLALYKHSIAIENSFHQGYFTEKLTDCFLAMSMPFYVGCPDIEKYFDNRSFIALPYNDFQNAITSIDAVSASDLYKQNLKYIHESRRLVMDKYQLIAALTDVLQRRTTTRRRRVTRSINTHASFLHHPIRRVINDLKQKLR